MRPSGSVFGLALLSVWFACFAYDANDRRALSYELAVLPIRLIPNLSPDSEITSDIFRLAHDHGVIVGAATEKVRTVKASDDVAAHLGCRTERCEIRPCREHA